MRHTCKRGSIFLITLFTCLTYFSKAQTSHFPGKSWPEKNPAHFGMDRQKLDSISLLLGGRGCIIKEGSVILSWGNQESKSDWLSSVKPIFSTLLFFAIEEGKIPGVHYKIKNLGWELNEKDQSMEFYHLANMTSGYARPEKPGKAWAYNDFAIQLYQKSLFDKIFREDPEKVFLSRLGALQFQDHPSFPKEKPRIYASVRDFARLGLFWINRGEWNNRQLLPAKYFRKYMKPQTPEKLPPTNKSAATNDYLKIGSFGGGSDHFTRYGAGIYGFNWWFNGKGRLHPRSKTWPDAPDDTFMTIGAGGNNMVMIPGQRLILSSARGNWGRLEAGNPQNTFNRIIKLLVSAAEK